MPWHKCTPALPKPIPANEAANAIWRMASKSFKSFEILGRHFTVVCSAHIEKMSATGLLPWYAGRSLGLLGRGIRSV